MVHYAVAVNGVVVGARTSKSHAVKIYERAVVVHELADGSKPGVVGYHSTVELALNNARGATVQSVLKHHGGGLATVVPVMTTTRRAKVGTPVLELETVAL